MANILAAASEQTDRPLGRRALRKWSRPTSALTIIGLSLLGWVILVGTVQKLSIF